LQLDEDRAFQRRYWTLQRLAWIGFAGILGLAMLGLTGGGGYFHMQRIRLGGALVEMPRVSRWDAADEMRITFDGPEGPGQKPDHGPDQGPDDGSGREHAVTIAAGYFDRFDLTRIRPEPAALLKDGGQAMTFQVQGKGPHVVRFSPRAVHFGWTSFDLTVNGATRRVGLMILP